jgi:hypothetical protein
VSSYTLRLLPDQLAVCRIDPAEPVPGWASAAGFSAIVRAADELSIVCVETVVPPGVLTEPGWRSFQAQGPFPFTAIGVLASLLQPLAVVGVGVFVISTYNTDYILVKAESVATATEALRRAGHVVID